MPRESNQLARAPESPGLAPARVARIKPLLEQHLSKIDAVLPRHLTPDRMIQLASLAAFKTPKLAQCSDASIVAAVCEAAQLGLELSPHLNEAWLLPVFNSHTGQVECQMRPGYQGLRKLATNTGCISYMQARLVHGRDDFELYYNPDLTFKHAPYLAGDPGVVTHVYAVAKSVDGSHLIEVLTFEQVEKIRQRSQSANKGPWVSDWGEMAKKTAIKRLCKSLPRSTELLRAIEIDDRDYAPAIEPAREPEPPRLSRSDALRRQLTADEELSQEPEIPAEDLSQEPEGRTPGEEG